MTMIALLSGQPKLVGTSFIIDVHGVGYEVHVSPATQAECLTQQTITIHTYTHVKEDTLELFGFLQPQDKELFLYLLEVQGIGPRTALNISAAGAAAIIEAVQQANSSFFSKIPRVGKKLGQKIIIELTSKLGSLKELDLTPLTDQETTVVEALVTLGFDDELSRSVVRQLDLSNLSVEQAIQQAIQHVGIK